MARPERNNVDYFPHEARHGKKMFVIESKYGNDGYSVWFKLLECLADANYHYLDLRDPTQSMYLASIMRVSEEKFNQILSDLATLGAIENELFFTHKIVWSSKLVESVQDAYSRRNNKCITLEGLREHLGVNVQQKPPKCKPKVGNNTQSKVEYTKEEKSIEEESIKSDESDKQKSFKKFTEEDFKNEVAIFKDLYPSEMLRKFYAYWIEKSPNGKMRFQLEKTWSTQLRLTRWSNNNFDSKSIPPTTEKAKAIKPLTNIL